MGFEQATIRIEKAQEFGELRAAVDRVFEGERVERFLKLLDRKGIRVRDFDSILAAKALEDAAGDSGFNALHLYQLLSLSDQAQIREFYLSRLETVDQALRHKFKKLYQYY